MEDNKISLREVALKVVADYVCKEFGLGDDYVITDFKAKNCSITLANQDNEVTVKLKGDTAEFIQLKISSIIEGVTVDEEETEE